MKRTLITLLVSLMLCSVFSARSQERYFTEEQLPDLVNCLPAPPDTQSVAFAYDITQYMWGKAQRLDPERADMAKRDAVWSYKALLDEYIDAFGLAVSEEATPAIWTLMVNSLSTLDRIGHGPKAYFHRRRPFERFVEAMLTGEEDDLRGNGSYPSGHTIRGWGAALLLAEINPGAAEAIFARGWAYGQSRVIAGAHWQSDVDAGRYAASIGYARLQTSPDFRAQMALAKDEFRRVTSATGQNGREYFVSLTEAVPDAILEIRYFSTYNFVGTRVDGYLAPTALMTRVAADSLRAVSDDLMRQGYRLKIYDAYRPQKAVDHFVRWAADLKDTRMKTYFYPDLNKNVLFKQDYIMEKSGHTRGSTVDLTIFDMRTEKEVDMGGTFDWFGHESHPDFCGNPDTGAYDAAAARRERRGITEQQFRNRMILRKAMLRHGFKPLDSEWWHFTLRDEPFPDTYFTFPVE